jgi:dTDP-4-amino-4,6-dideoxygalactose transaminase
MLRAHGSMEKYIHDYIGFNYRMEGLQGAILGVKIKYITDWTNKRIVNAKLYDEYLDKDKLIIPYQAPDRKSVYHLYIIQVSNREEVQNRLKQFGIETGIHYLIPIHLQKPYAYRLESYPVTERLSKRILSLPMYPELTEEQIKFICDLVNEVAKK